MLDKNLLNGLRFYTAIGTGATYIALPQELWSPALPDVDGQSICHCAVCKGANGYWDTLVIPGSNDRQPYTFTVHMPELQTGRAPDWLKSGHPIDHMQDVKTWLGRKP